MVDESAQVALEEHLDAGEVAENLPVFISYEIIHLFSEGLYQSPHKAIEELVTNGYDAGATQVRVLTPRSGEDALGKADSLWIVDDGTGMDADGFRNLWTVASSSKYDAPDIKGRKPVGQFGIGKLAAYVLAWRLTHVSKAGGKYRFTSMNFSEVKDRHHNDEKRQPLTVELHEVDEAGAKALLAEIETRSPDTWSILFGPSSSPTWTAAAMSDFKDLFEKLKEGTLSWVLRSGLPLTTNFAIYLNDLRLESSKASTNPILELTIGGDDDEQASRLGIATTSTGIVITGIDGEIRGTARLFSQAISVGKSQQYGRSNGFFIRVRGRVINLEDELFGLPALNHASWARFAMEVDADGLRDHLLSSREGVRDSDPVYKLREYLHAKFNACRAEFDRRVKAQFEAQDIASLLADAPAGFVIDPIIEAIASETRTNGRQLYYIETPPDSDESFASEFAAAVEEGGGPFKQVVLEPTGPYERLAAYDAKSQKLTVNREHPFVNKVITYSKNDAPAKLIATAEVLTDAFIRQAGFDERAALSLFEYRDQALRHIAGDHGPSAEEVLRWLRIADTDKDALERAVGAAFRTLGFSYEKRGGNRGGCDGLLEARLGRGGRELADFRVVYDAKTTDGTAVPADKVDPASLWDFAEAENAEYAIVIGKKFEAQSSDDGKLNKKLAIAAAGKQRVTIILTEDLARVVALHYRYGVTLTRLRTWFESGFKVADSRGWVDELENELKQDDSQVPVKLLLDVLEELKEDAGSPPNIAAARASTPRLREFDIERLSAALDAVSKLIGTRWVEVSPNRDVRLHQTAEQILLELDRRLRDDLSQDD